MGCADQGGWDKRRLDDPQNLIVRFVASRPRWVRGGHDGANLQCPLCPQKRTLLSADSMSALCQKRTLPRATPKADIAEQTSWSYTVHDDPGLARKIETMEMINFRTWMITCAARRALKPSLLRRRSWVVIIEVARDQLDKLSFV
jgi:hypothetical protein